MAFFLNFCLSYTERKHNLDFNEMVNVINVQSTKNF